MSDYNAESEEMQLLTAEYVRELIGIWTQIFDDATVRENLRRLADHARHIYIDLVTESKEKRSYVELEIEHLREEAQTLRRLLKVEVELPPVKETPPPLLVLQAEMDNSLTNLREQLRERRAQICELLLQQEALCEELGTPPRALLDDPLPSAGELQEFAAHLAALGEERVERLNRLSTMRREIKALQHSLELSAQTHHEQRLLHQRDIKLSADVFDELERLHKHYTQQQEEMHDQINTMRNKLETLWERLGEKPSDKYFDAPPAKYNQSTYDHYYAELQRCEKLRSANVKRFVQQIRGELTEWWERTLKSTQERERFTHFTSKCYTDDLLYLHEMELEDLKQHYERNKEIFQLYADRKILWERMCALEAKASDPNRFNNRGGQLLKEERERKTIANRLPKIELEIGTLVEEYERREHTPFLVHGENILELMAAEWARKQEEKETKCSARKQAATPASQAHSRSQLGGGRTPMSTMKKSSSISNLRKTPSTSSLCRGGSAIAATSSAHKRKLNAVAGHHVTPIAKRSLMHALSSPSVFLKPGTSSSAAIASGHKRRFRSPRVVATTIRRKSGRFSASGNSKKRRSMTQAAPKPSMSSDDDGCSDSGAGGGDGGSDDTYDSFEKCIESASRSSVLPTSAKSQADSSRVKRMRRIAAKENERLAQLPNPQQSNPQTPSRMPRAVRTPSKRFGGGGGGGGDNHASNSVQSPGHSGGSSRKLTTRNLPIII